MSQVIIQGKKIEVPDGASISISNDTVYVNGVPWDQEEKLSGVVKVEVHGDLLNLEVKKGDVEVHGSVHGRASAGGSLKCDKVGSDASAGGSIACGDVGGNASAGGSVKCGVAMLPAR